MGCTSSNNYFVIKNKDNYRQEESIFYRSCYGNLRMSLKMETLLSNIITYFLFSWILIYFILYAVRSYDINVFREIYSVIISICKCRYLRVAPPNIFLVVYPLRGGGVVTQKKLFCLILVYVLSCLCLVYVLSMSCLCLDYALSMPCLCLVYS